MGGQSWTSRRGWALVFGLALGLTEPGVAFADTTVDLPDDSLTQTLPDGTAVTLSVRDQYAIVSPAMVAVQT
ncbi:MAG: MspA family porin, partial [Segniliparus sp.]